MFLSLSQALKETYDEAADELSIDYAEAPPPPTLPPADAEWMRGLLNR